MKEYEIWMQGYSATGQRARHQFIGKAVAISFKEACKIAIRNWLRGMCSDEEAQEQYDRYYNEEYMRYWGCGLYDNEADAAKDFG